MNTRFSGPGDVAYLDLSGVERFAVNYGSIRYNLALFALILFSGPLMSGILCFFLFTYGGVRDNRVFYNVALICTPTIVFLGLWALLSARRSLAKLRLAWYDRSFLDIARELHAFRQSTPRLQRSRVWAWINLTLALALALPLAAWFIDAPPIRSLDFHSQFEPALRFVWDWLTIPLWVPFVDGIFGITVFANFVVAAVLALNGVRLLRSRPIRAIGGAAIGVVLQLVFFTCLLGLLSLFAGTLITLAPQIKALGLAQEVEVSILITIVVVTVGVTIGVSILCVSLLDRRREGWNLPSATHVVRRDSGKPIVLLRAFEDDDLTITATLSKSDNRKGVVRFEEFIAEQVERYGPFVAVGQPGRRPEGAAREFYGDEHWQRAVIAWMDQAQLLVAPPSWTAGLDWELRTAISRGHASKLVFVFPPGAANKQKRWAAVTAAFSDTPWGQSMAAARTTDALVAHTWASGEIVVISSSRAEENELAAALHVAVYGLLVRQAPLLRELRRENSQLLR